MRDGDVGRPEKLTVEDVKEAIKNFQTTSVYKLSEKLQVSHMTIHRKLQKIPEEEIESLQ